MTTGGNYENEKEKETSRMEVVVQAQEGPGYGFKEDKSLWTTFKVPCLGEIRYNPIVTLVAILIIWAFVAVCGVYQDTLPFSEWKAWIVTNFTWLYIGSQDVWAIFAIILYCSKYSNIKLGKDHEEPEYNDATWFMMLFACGIGTGLFFFGVGEPIFHYTGPNRYSADPTMPDNTLAQIALNITLYHWGIHGWIVYSLVGMLLGLMAYRENLPMTMKACFYPLIGDRIFGWIGDLIDITSIVTTLFGVCTSLGLGTRQINKGLNLINSDIPGDDTTVQVIVIWCITVVATISTVSGVGMGIRRLSETCFCVGMFLMIVVLFMDDTFYVLNLFVQSIGFYIQWIIQLGFHCDAFEQVNPSYGAADRNRWVPQGVEDTDGPKRWMDDWTMFYWGWWISWCPFVGMFIAKISRGRTIKQFINGTLTAPVMYSVIWLIIFGGTGIKQERAAAGQGLCCKSNSGWFSNVSAVDNIITERNIQDTVIQSTSAYFLCENGDCGPCASSILERKQGENATFGAFLTEYKTLGDDFGSISMNRSYARLSCHSVEQMWFDLMRTYSDLGEFLAGFSFIGIILYFVTSSDSGSLVIDSLSANGDPDPPRIQRVFWALMEGATATALLVAGGKEGLTALQTAGLLAGLPYTFIVCLLCVAIWRAVKVAGGDLDPNGPTYAIGILDPFLPFPYKEIANHKQIGTLLGGFFKNLIMAPFTIAEVHRRLNDGKKSWFTIVSAVSSFALFIVFHILQLVFDGSWAIAWFWYLCFVSIVTAVRMEARSKYKVNGNIAEDFFCSLLLYPNCAIQLDLTTRDLEDVLAGNHQETHENNIAMSEVPSVTHGEANEAYVHNERL